MTDILDITMLDRAKKLYSIQQENLMPLSHLLQFHHLGTITTCIVFQLLLEQKSLRPTYYKADIGKCSANDGDCTNQEVDAFPIDQSTHAYDDDCSRYKLRILIARICENSLSVGLSKFAGTGLNSVATTAEGKT